MAHAERPSPELQPLLEADQLRREMAGLRTMQGFHEPPIHFAPTYKCTLGKYPRTYANKRDQAPSFTDRVLHYSMPRCEHELRVTSYDAAPSITLSDHTPVGASYALKLRAHPRADVGYRGGAGSVHTHLRLSSITVELSSPLSASSTDRNSVALDNKGGGSSKKSQMKLPRFSLRRKHTQELHDSNDSVGELSRSAGPRLQQHGGSAARLQSPGGGSTDEPSRASTGAPGPRHSLMAGGRLFSGEGSRGGALQLACFGSFLEVGKCTVADELDFVAPTARRVAEERDTASLLSPSSKSPADAVPAAAVEHAARRRIAEIGLHPCVSDVAHLRQQHVLVLCRQGKQLLGGAAIPLAEMSGRSPAQFECTVTLRGRVTATIRGNGHLLEWRPERSGRRNGSVAQMGRVLASKLLNNNAKSGGGADGAALQSNGKDNEHASSQPEREAGLAVKHESPVAAMAGGGVEPPAPVVPVREAGEASVREWLFEAEKGYQASDYSFGGQEPNAYRRGTLWTSVVQSDEESDDEALPQMSAASTEGGQAIVAPRSKEEMVAKAAAATAGGADTPLADAAHGEGALTRVPVSPTRQARAVTFGDGSLPLRRVTISDDALGGTRPTRSESAQSPGGSVGSTFAVAGRLSGGAACLDASSSSSTLPLDGEETAQEREEASRISVISALASDSSVDFAARDAAEEAARGGRNQAVGAKAGEYDDASSSSDEEDVGRERSQTYWRAEPNTEAIGGMLPGVSRRRWHSVSARLPQRSRKQRLTLARAEHPLPTYASAAPVRDLATAGPQDDATWPENRKQESDSPRSSVARGSMGSIARGLSSSMVAITVDKSERTPTSPKEERRTDGGTFSADV